MAGAFQPRAPDARPSPGGGFVGRLQPTPASLAGRIGALGVIFHTGSHKGLGLEAVFDQICETAQKILAETPEETLMIFENSAGQGGTIGSNFADLGRILKTIGSKRAKICLDTCHAFAAGYDLSNAAGVAVAMEELEREVGIENVAAVHCNDSKTPLGAGRDSYGLGFQVTGAHTDALARSPGSLSWAGIFNTEFWIDPRRGVCAVLLMQYLPFYDPAAITTLQGFEQRVYQGLAH